MGRIIAVIGLAVLLVIHFFIRDRIKYDIGWILHLAAGFFLAIFWMATFPDFSALSLIIFVGFVALGWEALEYIFRGGEFFTPGRYLDVSLPLLGAAFYNLIHVLFK